MKKHPWLEQVKTLRWNKFYVVTGTGGVRTEMIALWLSQCHSSFHDYYEWRISPRTGSSNVNYPFVYNADVKTVLETLTPYENDFIQCHDASSNKNIISKAHQCPKLLFDSTPNTWHDFFHIIAIDIKNINDDILKKLQWEFVSKTWLDNIRLTESFVEEYISDFPDQSNEDFNVLLARALRRCVKNICDPHAMENFISRQSESLSEEQKSKITTLDYIEILKPSGGEYICEKLGIEQDTIALDSWKTILPITHTPETIRFRGVDWNLEKIMNS